MPLAFNSFWLNTDNCANVALKGLPPLAEPCEAIFVAVNFVFVPVLAYPGTVVVLRASGPQAHAAEMDHAPANEERRRKHVFALGHFKAAVWPERLPIAEAILLPALKLAKADITAKTCSFTHNEAAASGYDLTSHGHQPAGKRLICAEMHCNYMCSNELQL